MKYLNFLKKVDVRLFGLILFVVIGVYLFSSSTVYGDLDYSSEVEVMVYEGDTVWDIAKKHNYYEEDVRYVVGKIIVHNDLEDCMIYPGDLIKIPVGELR